MSEKPKSNDNQKQESERQRFIELERLKATTRLEVPDDGRYVPQTEPVGPLASGGSIEQGSDHSEQSGAQSRPTGSSGTTSDTSD